MIRSKICATMPFFCIIAFVLIGYITGEWKYAWLIFLLIPITPYLVGKSKLVITYPILVIVIYLLLGFLLDLWHPGWVVFFTIPIYYIWRGPKIAQRFKNKFKDTIINND